MELRFVIRHKKYLNKIVVFLDLVSVEALVGGWTHNPKDVCANPKVDTPADRVYGPSEKKREEFPERVSNTKETQLQALGQHPWTTQFITSSLVLPGVESSLSPFNGTTTAKLPTNHLFQTGNTCSLLVLVPSGVAWYLLVLVLAGAARTELVFIMCPSVVERGTTWFYVRARVNESSERPLSPLSDSSYPPDLPNNLSTNPVDLQRVLRLPPNCSPSDYSTRLQRLQQSSSPPIDLNRSSRYPESPQSQDLTRLDTSRSPSPPQTRLTPDDVIRDRRSSRSPSPQSQPPPAKGPIVVPGIPAGLVRPFPINPPQSLDNLPKPPGMPGPFLNAQEMVQAAHNHQHLLAAQFQAAAALAHVQAGQGFPPGGGGPHPHMLHPNHPNIPRDSYPLYPWLLSRHGRHVFPPRFPGTDRHESGGSS
ncbi:emx homeobox protein [Culex quinquefasciatus]|uniref:Emx homeobox protein n=1 Tax=Culex quinquefasciatus TaxID=7176 RepID=B0WPJ2_CULQU|nr:emx homeobox protein [Culex quinquefasciatus]|eukprot:XP_001850626.1 emx homeobox protein [Culex quinquefasciatus]